MIKIFLVLMLMTTSSFAALTVNNVPRTKTGGTGPTLQDSVISQPGSNVGIGTTSPSEVLEVNGNVKATSFIGTTFASTISGIVPIANLATGTPDGTKFVKDDGTLAVPPGGGGVGSSQWTTSGNDIYYNTGNVGIGSSAPEAALVVNGAVKFSSAGNVGIASTNPGQLLDVYGGRMRTVGIGTTVPQAACIKSDGTFGYYTTTAFAGTCL